MPSATAQLESSGEETQHPDNGTGYRGLALRLNLGKLTAQLIDINNNLDSSIPTERNGPDEPLWSFQPD